MTTFQDNIISIYGAGGKLWLDELPQLVASLSSRLGLSDLKEGINLSYNYVLSGFQCNNPIILKLGLDREALKQEACALKCFADYGAVKILVAGEGILLLERITSGTSLKNYFPDEEPEAIGIVCKVMKKLHLAKTPEHHNFSHIKDWLSALDKDWDIPLGYLQKSRKLRDQLLQNSGPDTLLHGDLHHGNILQNGENWAVIDPKGVIGEQAYEVAAFIRNPIPELLNHDNAPNIIHDRIVRFTEILELPSQRILDWCFVQAVLSWAWALEDSCDTSYFEQLVRVFYDNLIRCNKINFY